MPGDLLQIARSPVMVSGACTIGFTLPRHTVNASHGRLDLAMRVITNFFANSAFSAVGTTPAKTPNMPSSAQSTHSHFVFALTALCLVLHCTAPANAQDMPPESRWKLDLGFGPSFAEGNDYQTYGGLTVGATLGVHEHFVLRGAVGAVAGADPHSIGPMPLFRLEGATRWRVGSFVPLLGLGATEGAVGPIGHALAGGAFDISPRWACGLDLRGGRGFERDASFLMEGMIRLTRSF